ncbi:MAG: YwiC-like family protein [Chloroflexota bacterium]
MGTQAAQQQTRVRLGPPPVPNDHGAYAMLLVPMLLGFLLAALSGSMPNTNALVSFTLFAVSLMSLFFASEPLGIVFRPRASVGARRRASLWLGIYLLLAVASGAPLLFIRQLWGLGWFLIPAAALMLLFLVAVKLRKQRSLGVRLPGIIGLTLSAPAAYYVATGTMNPAALGLWAACVVYFVGTVFNVRAWFEANKQKRSGVARPQLPTWLVCSTLVYLASGVLVISICAMLGALPWAAFVAFVPSLLRAGWTLWRTPVHLTIKTVGLIEFAQSFMFALLLVITIASAM